MTAISQSRATLDDLYREKGKAELIKGRIFRFMPAGDLPSAIAGEIFVSLRLHAKATGAGKAYGDSVGYAVSELPSERQSFSPDASYYVGPPPVDRMRFIEGAPTFAVEVRSENDYGNTAEMELAAKRADYFAAGTQVVWDVDPRARTVAVYREGSHTQALIYRSGETAEAEPAVPGWQMTVDEIFAV
jgi:Uma2 family endonuclease